MEMKFWQVYLWYTVIGHCVCAIDVWEPVSVSPRAQLSVTRGGQVDLRHAILFTDQAATADCQVQFIARDHCGRVEPTRFGCSSYSGPILYQHFGCLSERELPTFLVSSRTEIAANVSTFSVEIIIEAARPPTSEITVELIEEAQSGSPPLLQGEGTYNYRIVFPTALIGRCHYEVVTEWPHLSLPILGTLIGASNQPVPCGLMPSSGLTYVPSNSSSPATEDHLLIKVHSHDKYAAARNQFIILPVNLEVEGNASAVHEIPTQHLVVRQGANTPIPASLLAFPTSLSHRSQLHLGNSHHYIFPVLNAGSFRSILSSSTNVSHTTFTDRELLSGDVAFYPSFFAPLLMTYRYNVSNAAGVVVAVGEVAVFVEAHDWDWPVQRTNQPTEVMEGGATFLDHNIFDFYLQTDTCLQHAMMTVVVAPEHGHVTFLNGSSLRSDDIVLIGALKNGSVFVYHHTGGSEEMTDSIIWEVSCFGGPLLQVFTSILVAPIRDLPTVLSGGWDITVHRSWATPLSPSAVMAYDVDSPLDEAVVTLNLSSEGLVKINWEKLRGRDVTYLPPFVEAKTLFDLNATKEVTSFTLAELEAYRIWYLPPDDTSLDNEILTFSINDSTATIGVNISDADLRHSLLFSTLGEYPSLANNLPLPLHTHLGTYITSSYLYSRAIPYSSKKVTYIVRSPPTNGLLCLLSGEKCQTSITHFTQRDINSQKLFYKQNESASGTIKEDGFDFELTMDGFQQHSAVLHRFHFKPVQNPPVSVAMDRIFYVNAEGGKPIAPRHFRPFSHYLNSREITFHIIRRPHYGYLNLNGTKHPDSFTFQNLLDRVLTYEHDPSATDACSDQFSFSVGNSTHSVEGTMDIAIRRGREDIHFQVTVGQHTLYPGQRKFVFGSDDINVSSSFCLDQVTFSLGSPPSMGVLTLVDNKHNTVVQLEENSTFTANDIYSGFLHYTFTPLAPVVKQIYDVFNLVARDPTSVWPPPDTNRQNPGRTTGHFNVTIIPVPNVEHNLVINITSPGFLSWLPSYGVYGYIFSEEDIVIYNSTIEPDQVVIQIDISPMFGEIWKDDAMNNIFTVEDVNNGLVRYQSKVRLNGISSDSFQMSIIVSLKSFRRIAARAEFSVDWATVQLQNGTLRVSESAGEVEIVVRRTGALWFESQVLLSTRAESARTNPDCHSPADFCNTTRSLVFPVDSAEVRIIIPINDDDIAEDTESFMVSLSNPSNAVIDENQNHTVVWITDTGDYSVITMLGDPGYSECSHVTRVEEWVGQANITLQRMGNLEQRVGVVCHTLPLSASEFSDYLPRQQHPNSTVWFEVNQREANCSIEIINDTSGETLERFYVQLGEEVRGRAVLGEPGAIHCIEINNDREDWPKVNFTTTELVIRENETADVLVPIVFNRTGPDLTFEMPAVKLQSYIESGEDDAMFGTDFDLPANESCPERNPGVSCVTFAPGQTTAVLHVIIKRDTILEANESFHLIIISPFRHTPYGMKVTILESAPPAIIGFASPVTRLNESGSYVHLESVPIVRSGYLNSSVAVLCRVKGAPTFGNATPTADFLTSPKPSKVTFNEGDTHKACSLFIKDDGVWEGPEILRVELELDPNESLGAKIAANASSTVVVIDDPEDTPMIEFKKNVYDATEPLSNFDIDRTVTTLTLMRHGNLSYTTAVRYVIEGDPASFQSPSDPSQEVVFHPQESTKELEIVLRANYEKNTVAHDSLIIRLVEGWVLGNVSVPVRLGEYSTTVITIDNRDYSGPFFPDLPVVANVGDSLMHTSLFYDLPLHCITPCSSLYLAERERLNITRQGCAAQNITQETAMFSWEVSRDGINFTALEHATALTNTHSEILDTFYLKSGFYVRCLARAVSLSGVRGHTRTSRAVFLGGKRYSCDGRGETAAELTSYSSFDGHSEDLLRLTIRVPHYNNTIPVLSSHPIRDKSDLENSSSSCSTLLPYDHSPSWMDNKPLYSHLDRERCVWEFSKWLPVEDWLEQCGARRQGEDHSATSSINITVYSAYIQLNHQLTTHALTGDHSTVFAQIIINPSSRAVFLPPPIHTLPENRDKLNGSAHIFPIAVEQSSESESTIFQIYFSSLSPLMADRRTYAAAVANTSSNRPPALLHTDTIGNTSKQIWLWEFVGATLPTTIPVVLYPTSDQAPLCEADCSTVNGGGDDDAALQFPLAVASDGGGVYRPTLRATVTLQHDPDVVSNRTETFTLGEPVYIVFELDPCLEIQAGFTFAVSELRLCQPREAASLPLPGGTCLNLLRTVTGVAMETSPFDVPLQRREHMAILQFNTLSIDVVQYSSQAEWYLELSYGIATNTSTSRKMVVTEHTVLDISLDLTQSTTTGALSTVGEAPMPQSMQLLYAAVAILVVALVIMASGFTVIGTLVWTTKMRMQIKSKVQNELEARRMSMSASRKNSMALNNKRKEPDGGERGGEQGLRRAQSTIGFPTREKLKRARSKKSTTTTTDRAEVGPDQPMSHCEAGARAMPRDEGASVQPSKLSPPLCTRGTMTRARSLPNLNILETRTSEGFFMGEPQPRKLRFQTTVSKVNTERWHLNKWAQHHIKANKQLETARTIHDIATRRRNYGANESKQNSSLKEGHNELARYAVRSLAASAKTPEPERGGPRTKL